MSWEDLEKRREQASPEAEEWARLHAVVFASGPGRDLLDRYHKMIVDAPCGPEASEALLRWRDAQRALIRSMEALTERARQAKS